MASMKGSPYFAICNKSAPQIDTNACAGPVRGARRRASQLAFFGIDGRIPAGGRRHAGKLAATLDHSARCICDQGRRSRTAPYNARKSLTERMELPANLRK